MEAVVSERTNEEAQATADPALGRPTAVAENAEAAAAPSARTPKRVDPRATDEQDVTDLKPQDLPGDYVPESDVPTIPEGDEEGTDAHAEPEPERNAGSPAIEASTGEIIRNVIKQKQERAGGIAGFAAALREKNEKKHAAEETLRNSPGSFTVHTTHAAAQNYLADQEARAKAGELMGSFRKPERVIKLKRNPDSPSPSKKDEATEDDPPSPIDMVYSAPNTPAKPPAEEPLPQSNAAQERDGVGKLLRTVSEKFNQSRAKLGHKLRTLSRKARESGLTVVAQYTAGTLAGIIAGRAILRAPFKFRENIHTVIQGDTMWHIAEDHCGDPARYVDEIVEKNADRFDSTHRPELIWPGERIVMPQSCKCDSDAGKDASARVSRAQAPPAAPSSTMRRGQSASMPDIRSRRAAGEKSENSR